jgi:hypothetical protein
MDAGELVIGLTEFFSGLDLSGQVTGWGPLSWGMSWQSALRHFPQAEQKSDYTLSLNSSPGEARQWSLELDFDAGRQLQSVTLSFAGSQETADFARISRQLSRRLGHAAGQTQTSSVWTRDQSTVTLSRSPGGGLVLSETV